MAEIVRSGLLSVDPGQELAGRALGMTRRRILQRVIIPQAVRIVIPPMGNEFITLLKLTSLASVISLHELLTASQERATASFRYPEAYAAALVYYLGIVSILMVLQAQLERRFTWSSAGRRRRLVAGHAPGCSHSCLLSTIPSPARTKQSSAQAHSSQLTAHGSRRLQPGALYPVP